MSNELARQIQMTHSRFATLQKEADRVAEARNEMIREAMSSRSVSIELLQTLTGLSRERLYQIRAGGMSGRDKLAEQNPARANERY